MLEAKPEVEIWRGPIFLSRRPRLPIRPPIHPSVFLAPLRSYTPVVNQSLVPDPTIRQLGFDLPRHTWSMLNRFLTGRGTCRADLHQWGLSTSESCSCGQKKTMSHIVDSCPLSQFEGGLQQLHTADDHTVHWLETAAKTAPAK